MHLCYICNQPTSDTGVWILEESDTLEHKEYFCPDCFDNWWNSLLGIPDSINDI